MILIAKIDRADPGSERDHTTSALSASFLDETGGGKGAGQAVLPYDYPVAEGDMLRVVIDGEARGVFEVETIKGRLYSVDGDYRLTREVSGPGWIGQLDHAVVYPEVSRARFEETNDRLFSFASKRGRWYDPADWIPAVEVEPKLASGGIWGGRPKEWPEGVTNAHWIWDRPQASTKTAPVGAVYFRKEFTITKRQQYDLYMTVDDFMVVFLDGEVIADQVGSGSWKETTKVSVVLEVGDHVLAVHAENRTYTDGLNAAGFLLAMVDPPFASIHEELPPTNADLILATGSDWLMVPYPEDPPGWTIGEILTTLLDEAKARGVDGVKGLVPTWTDDADSNGEPWGGRRDFVFEVGKKYGEVFEEIAALGYEAWVDHQTGSLHVGLYRGRNRTGLAESDLQAQLDVKGFPTEAVPPSAAEVGLSTLGAVASADLDLKAEIANAVLLKSTTQYDEDVLPDSVTKFGRREAFLSVESPAGTAPADRVVKQAFRRFGHPQAVRTYELHHSADGQFSAGDWVMIDNGAGEFEPRFIASKSVSQTLKGEKALVVELDSVMELQEKRMARWIENPHGTISGGIIGSGAEKAFGGTSASYTSAPQPVVAKYDSRTPEAPVLQAPTREAYLKDGRWQGRITAPFTHTGNATNGRPLDLGRHDLYIRPKGTINWRMLDSIPSENRVGVGENVQIRDSAGKLVTYQLRAKTSSLYGVLSDWSNVVEVTMADDTTPPPVPVKPDVGQQAGIVAQGWPGTFVNNASKPTDFSHVEHQWAMASAGPWTDHGSMNTRGQLVLTGIEPGKTVYFRARSVDTSGNASAWSAVSSLVVEALTANADLQAVIEDLEADAQAKADAARQAAIDAGAAADDLIREAIGEKGNVLIQTATPAADMQNDNTLWIDTTGGANTPKWWNGSSWEAVTDKVAIDAANAAAAAKSTADAAVLAAQNAQDEAEDALVAAGEAKTAAGDANSAALAAAGLAGDKGKVIYQASAPTGANADAKNLWIRTSDNRPHTYNGSTWVAVSDKVATDAASAAAAANALAASKVTTYFGSSAPTSPTSGDLWFDSSAGKTLKRYSGSAWVVVTDEKLAEALSKAGDAQATADGKIRTFAQTSEPTGMKATDVGDLWLDTDDGNRMHRWSGTAWVVVQDEAISEAKAAADNAASAAAAAAGVAAGKADVLIQSTTPPAGMRKANTLWIDTTDGLNTPKRWNGSSWAAVTDKVAVDAAAAAAAAKAAADAAKSSADGANALAAAAQSAAGTAQSTADEAARAAADAQSRAVNVLPNASFERGSFSGWGGVNHRHTVVEVPDAKGGRYVDRHIAAGQWDSVQSAPVTVVEGQTWRISAWWRKVEGDLGSVQLMFRGTGFSNDRGTVSVGLASYAAGEWFRLQTEYTVPAGVTELWLKAQVSASRTSGIVELDELSMQDVTDVIVLEKAARDALALAASKVTTFYGSSTPTATTVGDLWLDSGNGNALKRWSGSAWVAVSDQKLQEALAAAGDAQATADGKVRTFAQDSAPTGMKATDVGDLWVDTDDSNRLYRWSGTAWANVRDETISAAQAKADAAAAAAASAAGVANSKGKVIYSSTEPSAADRLSQNLWIDLTGGANTPKRWSGSAWVAVTDKVALDAAAAAVAAKNAADAAQRSANNAQTTANGKSRIFHSTQAAASSAPGETTGDLWHQYNTLGSGMRLLKSWRWNGSAWIELKLDATYLPLVDIGTGTFGSLSGQRLESRSVSAEHLMVSDFTNHFPDPQFLHPSGYSPWTVVDGGLEKAGTGAQNFSYWAHSAVYVQPGERYYASARRTDLAGATGDARMYWQRSSDGVSWAYGGAVLSLPSGRSEPWAGELVIPDGVKFVRFAFATEANMPSTTKVRISDVQVRRMNAGELIVDGSIRGSKLDMQEIWTNTAWLGVARASSLTLESIVGDYQTRVSGTGLVVSRIMDAGSDPVPVIQVGGAAGNSFSTIDPLTGEVLGGISEQGDGSFVNLASTEDPVFGGSPLIGSMSEFEKPGDIGGMAYLDRVPRGVVGGGYRSEPPANGAFSAGEEVGFLEVSFREEPGRMYRITVIPPHALSRTGGIDYRLRWARDRAGVTLTDPQLARWAWADIQGNGYMTAPYVYFHNSVTANGTMSLLLTMRSSDTWALTGNSDYKKMCVFIEDVGPTIGAGSEHSVDRLITSGGTAVVDPTPAPKTDRKTIWLGDWMSSYYNGGSSRQVSGMGSTMLKQGRDPYWASGGIQTSAFGITTGADSGSYTGSTIAGALAGARPYKGYVRVKSAYASSGGSRSVRMYWHNLSSAPSSFNPSETTVIREVRIGDGSTVDIPLTEKALDAIAAGNVRGFGFSPGGSTSSAYALGLSWSTRPRLVLHYKR